MFILNANHPPNFKEYGICLPVPPERFLNLKQWVVNSIPTTQFTWLEENYFNQDDYLRCHSENYFHELMNNPENQIKACFELDNSNGRYRPETMSRPLAELANRIMFHSGGTYLSGKLALTHRHAFFVGGGYHHALSDGPSGFCLVNDIALALRKLQSEGSIKRAWVIDVDAHMGDGTAQITAGDDSITTFSIHMSHGWPLDGTQTYPIQSDIDIAISHKQQSQYCSRLVEGLNQLKTNFSAPDLIIFNQGTDPYEKDALASTTTMKLTAMQMLERDEILFNFADDLDIPACYLLSGGYGPFAHEPTINFWESLKKKNLWK